MGFGRGSGCAAASTSTPRRWRPAPDCRGRDCRDRDRRSPAPGASNQATIRSSETALDIGELHGFAAVAGQQPDLVAVAAPGREEVNARYFPSGLQRGAFSLWSLLVTWRSVLPSKLIIQMCALPRPILLDVDLRNDVGDPLAVRRALRIANVLDAGEVVQLEGTLRLGADHGSGDRREQAQAMQQHGFSLHPADVGFVVCRPEGGSLPRLTGGVFRMTLDFVEKTKPFGGTGVFARG